MTVPIYDGPWRLLSDDGHTRKWLRQHPDQPDSWIVRTQTYVNAELAEHNAEHLKASEGKRFGEGQVVARIPLTELYRGSVGEAFRAGDHPWMKRWLNDADQAWLRTFRGRL